ncbi:hypothetical protein MKW94_004978 [Papaver nudicaule]|uniref:UDP-3-O-acyl-N-acetylglucosamine deacetylase n=1 Tax=Papaver nudicaule TaxID=74823 RepID=A0AA41V587_PAPNU|nr:hypothetical protein [Papaver nudicaule]
MNHLKQTLRAASSSSISWKPTEKLQQTISSEISKSGKTLHSGDTSTVRLLPALAGEGRYFVFNGREIPASIDFTKESPLCTTLSRNGVRVRTVEHLLSALEALNVDNCRIEVTGADEVPLLDGSAKELVEAVDKSGLSVCKDNNGNTKEKLAPFVNEPVHVWRNDSFIAAFPSPRSFLPGRNGLIKGGSAENAIVCCSSEGWLNPPLRFNEPCQHKVLDLVGDLSVLLENGNQGFPVAHIVAYKGGHSYTQNLFAVLLGKSLEEDSLLLTPKMDVSTRC